MTWESVSLLVDFLLHLPAVFSGVALLLFLPQGCLLLSSFLHCASTHSTFCLIEPRVLDGAGCGILVLSFWCFLSFLPTLVASSHRLG